MLKFGSYVLSPIDVIIIGLAVYIAVKTLRKWFRASIPKPEKFKSSLLRMQDFTKEEFEKFQEDEDERCLVVYKGKVFDMTKSRLLYEANRHIFDSENEMIGPEWERLLNRKYPFIGRIVRRNVEKMDEKYDGRYAVPFDEYTE